MSVEQVKSSSSSTAAAGASASVKGPAKGGKDGGAGSAAGFLGLLDGFAADLAQGTDAGALSAGDAAGLDAGAQPRRKPGVLGDGTDSAQAVDGGLPTDLVSQMALLAEAARQAAEAAGAAGATGAAGAQAGNAAGAGAGPVLAAVTAAGQGGPDATRAITDPAALAAAAAAAQKDGASGASAATAASDAARSPLEAAGLLRKGHRELIGQLQSPLQTVAESGKAVSTAEATTLGAVAPLSKADQDFKDLAARVLDGTPLAASNADEGAKLVTASLGGSDAGAAASLHDKKAQVEERTGSGPLPTLEGLDRGQPLGVSAASASASGSGLNDSNARSPEEVVAEQVSYWVHQKRQAAELTLDGGNGQPVAVSISMNGNEAHVAFRSDQAATRDMLNGALPELKTLLQGEGLVLAGVSVGAGGASSEGSSSARQGSEALGGLRRAGARATPGQGMDEAAAPVLRRSVNSNRSLDLFV